MASHGARRSSSRRWHARTLAGAGIAVVAASGCGSEANGRAGAGAPVYTDDPTYPKAAQLYHHAQPALARALPERFACALLPVPAARGDGKLVVVVTDEAALGVAREVVGDLGGEELTELRVERSAPALRAQERLVQRLRARQPRGVVVNLGSDVLVTRCPRVEILVDRPASAATRAWLRRVDRRYGERLSIKANTARTLG